jgi:ATPase family associated with various cellular activities (AAA)
MPPKKNNNKNKKDDKKKDDKKNKDKENDRVDSDNDNDKNKKNKTNQDPRKTPKKQSGNKRPRDDFDDDADDDNDFGDFDDGDDLDPLDLDDLDDDLDDNNSSSPPPKRPPNIFLLLKQFNKELDGTLESKMNKKKPYICPNPICDHGRDIERKIKKPDIKYINNLSQLIELGKSYHCKINKQYGNINLRVLCELIEPLEDLQKMIGLDSVKNKIIDQLLYFLQGYHNNEKKCMKCIDCEMEITCMKNQGDMLHTCISGPPGVGKTALGRCFGKIYRKMGILSNDHFKIYTRSDLVGEYLGHTAVKTQKCIDECKGGVMFIDEAYALGNEEKRDSFSKECIDTLNQNLSERRDFLCIIAGYKDCLENCFFKYNEGLNRRFTFRYEIEPYKWSELKRIFELKVKEGGFNVCYNIDDSDDSENVKVQNLFKENKQNFPNSGGDMETLFLKAKIVHSRTISNDTSSKYILSLNDMKKGIEMFISNRKLKDDDASVYSHMFI